MIDRTARNRARNTLLVKAQTGEGTWHCCGINFDVAPAVYRHIASQHTDTLKEQTLHEVEFLRAQKTRSNESLLHDAEFTSRRAEKYGSDPISLNCTCDPTQGTVLLFYAYLPLQDPLTFARLHKSWSTDLNLCGKVKIAHEGINATLAGPTASIHSYMDLLSSTLEFKALGLDQPSTLSETERTLVDKKRFDFFKPTSGCGHVFGNVMSIKVVDEICPLGAPELDVYRDPKNKPGKLPPVEFHQKMKDLQGQDDVVVLDVRNYYESNLGHFPNAITPPIRKFSSFRDYVDRNKDQFAGKTILSYCTGGIRCEKATSYLRQSLATQSENASTNVWMLDGGIHNYLEWIKREGLAKDSLWLGKNYVFDARQSMGLAESTKECEDSDTLVSSCEGCQQPSARYVKCDGFGCHRLIIACTNCAPAEAEGESRMCCCQECRDMGEKVLAYSKLESAQQATGPRVKRGICACERARRIALGVEKENE